MFVLPVNVGNLIGAQSASVGTPWYAIVPGTSGAVTRLVALETVCGATDNGIYLMRPLNQVPITIQTAKAAADTTLILNYDPSPSNDTISSGDQVVYLASDGTYRRVTVSSWNASTRTLTVSALPAAVAAGSPMWNFGIHTDTEPGTSVAFPKLSTPTSQTYTRELAVGFAGRISEPLLLYCPNATNATSLNHAEYAA